MFGNSILLSLLLMMPGSKDIQEIKRQMAGMNEKIYKLEQMLAEVQQKPDNSVAVRDEMRTQIADLKDQFRLVRQEVGQLNATLGNLNTRVTELEKRKSTAQLVTGPNDGSATQTTVSGELIDQQFNQARLDYERGKYEVAETGFNDLLSNFPNSAFQHDCLYFMGMCRFKKESWDQAREWFAKASSHNPKGRYSLQAQLYEGQSYYQQGLYAKAVGILDELILKHPDSQEAALARRFQKQKGM